MNKEDLDESFKRGSMKFLYYLITLFILTSCFSRNAVMTREGYMNIEEGMTMQEVEQKYGKPYNIYSKGDDTITYEYIEKIRMGNEVLEQRRYYIIISEGKVIGKYMKLSNPPPFEAIYSDNPYPDY